MRGTLARMDIHAPDKPVHSWREFAVHIGIVTIGILIALGFDGIREHFRERRLLRETRENVRYEMEANQKHMSAELERVAAIRSTLDELVKGMPDNLRDHPDSVRAVVGKLANPGYFFAVNSWQTALSTGAPAHMSTAEVSAYGYAAGGVANYVKLQAEAQHQEAVTKAYLAAYPHPTGDQLALAMQNLLLFDNAEEALTYVGPQTQGDLERAMRATRD